ncbi:hypothetical protein BCR36DRAFT_229812, partial [Piromyces finnis]
LYEEQPDLHEIEFEANNISLIGSFVSEENVINKNFISINELVESENNSGITFDKFTTKIVFSILSIDRDGTIIQKDDKFLIGTYFGNLKFNFGSSKLSSNTLIVIVDLIRLKLLQLSKLLPIKKKNNNTLYNSDVSLSSSSCDSSYGQLSNYSNSQLKKNNLYYSTPELYVNKNQATKEKCLQNMISSSMSVNTNSSNYLESAYESLDNCNEKQKIDIFSYYMFIFDLKINTISFSILNPEDECGFQSDIKKINFHYNNNCYIMNNNTSNKKLIIKTDNNIKNQFSFNVKEIDLYYLDTIKYLKKGIVMHNFLKINDILISIVDVNTSNLLINDNISSISSFSNTESMESVSKIKLINDNAYFNKINFNIKKIRMYFSLNVFFSLLSTGNSILKKIIKPFMNSLERSVSQSMEYDIDSKVSDSILN